MAPGEVPPSYTPPLGAQTPASTPVATPMAPTITPQGEVAPTGLSPQALAQLSILQQMSFNPYAMYGA
jgi:hypothetical protein